MSYKYTNINPLIYIIMMVSVMEENALIFWKTITKCMGLLWFECEVCSTGLCVWTRPQLMVLFGNIVGSLEVAP